MEQQMSHHLTLKAARVNKGLTPRALADAVGVDRRTLAKLERGEAIHPAKAKRIADFFEMQVTDLMSVEEAA